MKKYFLILLLILPFISFAQETTRNNPSRDEIQKWVGKNVVVRPDIYPSKYGGFIKDRNEDLYVSDNVFKPDAIDKTMSSYATLVNQVFTVIAVYPDPTSPDITILELNSKTLGKCYYYYDKVGYFWLKLAAELKYPVGSPCNAIETKKDEFTDKVSFSTPAGNTLYLEKTINKGTSTYLLSVAEYSSGTGIGNGVYLLLDDKTQISRDSESQLSNAAGDDYRHTGYIILTSDELEKLKTHLITAIKVYVYGKSVPAKESNDFMQMLNCIVASK